MEGKVAVIGDADFVMPFSALGVDTYAVEQDTTDILDNARDILSKNYALVVVAENIASQAQSVFETAKNKPIPCIVVVPFTTASEGFATRELGNSIKMATK